MEAIGSSTMQRRLWYAALLLGFILVSLNAYRLLAMQRADPDQFWHVATGRYVVEHRAVPLTDPFSWYGRARHARWIAHEWLFGVIAYGLHAAGGFAALYAFTAMLHGALFLLSYAWTFLRTRREVLSLGVAVLAVLGTRPNLAPRPQMITFCLLLVIAILGEKKKLWWALPIVLLGANVHGAAYPMYLVVVAFYAVPAAPLVLAAALPLVLLNPNGTALLSYALGVTNPDAAFIQEFRPTALITRPMDLAVYFGSLVVLWGQRFRLKDGVLVFLLILLSLSAVRQVAFFYVLALPIMAAYVPGKPREEPLAVPLRRPALGFLDLAPLAALGVAVVMVAQLVVPLRPDAYNGYPVTAADYVKAHKLTRVFNIWGDGGFLIYYGVPPMIDGRGDPFMAAGNHGVDMAHDYLTMESLQTDPHAFFGRYGVRNLLVRKTMILYTSIADDPAFTTLYEDPRFAVMRYTPPGSTPATATAP